MFQITTLYTAPFQCLPLSVSDYTLYTAPFQCLPLSVSDYTLYTAPFQCLPLSVSDYNPIRSSISVFASFCFWLQPYTQLHFSVCLFLFQITTLYAAPFQCLPLSVSDYNPIRSSISVFASFCFRLNPIRSSISVFASFCFRLHPIHSSISVFASFCFRLRPYMQLNFSAPYFNAGLSTMQPSRATAWMDNCSSWWQLTARFCQSMSATLTVSCP